LYVSILAAVFTLVWPGAHPAAARPSMEDIARVQRLIENYTPSLESKNAIVRDWEVFQWIEKQNQRYGIDMRRITTDAYNHRAAVVRECKQITAETLRRQGCGKEHVWGINNTGSWLDPDAPKNFAADMEFTWKGTDEGTRHAKRVFDSIYHAKIGEQGRVGSTLPGEVVTWSRTPAPHPDQYRGGAARWVDVYNTSRPGSAELIGTDGTVYSKAHTDAVMGLGDDYPRFEARHAVDLAERQLDDWRNLYASEMNAAEKLKKGTKHLLRSDKARRVVMKQLGNEYPRAVREAMDIKLRNVPLETALSERVDALMSQGLSREDALRQAIQNHLKEADALINGNARYVRNVQRLHRGTGATAGARAARTHPRNSAPNANRGAARPSHRLPRYGGNLSESEAVFCQQIYDPILDRKAAPQLRTVRGHQWLDIVDVTPDEVTKQVMRKFNYDLVVNRYPELLDVAENRRPVLRRIVKEMVQEQVEQANRARHEMWQRLPKADQQAVMKTRSFWDKHKAIPESKSLIGELIAMQMLTDAAVTWYDDGAGAAAVRVGTEVGVMLVAYGIGKVLMTYYPQSTLATSLAQFGQGVAGGLSYLWPVIVANIAYNTAYLVGNWTLDVVRYDTVDKLYSNPGRHNVVLDYWTFLNNHYLPKKGITIKANRGNLVAVFPEQNDLVTSVYAFKTWYNQNAVFNQNISMTTHYGYDAWLYMEQAALKDWEVSFNKLKGQIQEQLQIEVAEDCEKLAQFEAYCLSLIKAGDVRDPWPRCMVLGHEVDPQVPKAGRPVTVTTKIAVFGTPLLDTDLKLVQNASLGTWQADQLTEEESVTFGKDKLLEIHTFEHEFEVPLDAGRADPAMVLCQTAVTTAPGDKSDALQFAFPLEGSVAADIEGLRTAAARARALANEVRDLCQKAGWEVMSAEALLGDIVKEAQAKEAKALRFEETVKALTQVPVTVAGLKADAEKAAENLAKAAHSTEELALELANKLKAVKDADTTEERRRIYTEMESEGPKLKAQLETGRELLEKARTAARQAAAQRDKLKAVAEATGATGGTEGGADGAGDTETARKATAHLDKAEELVATARTKLAEIADVKSEAASILAGARSKLAGTGEAGASLLEQMTAIYEGIVSTEASVAGLPDEVAARIAEVRGRLDALRTRLSEATELMQEIMAAAGLGKDVLARVYEDAEMAEFMAELAQTYFERLKKAAMQGALCIALAEDLLKAPIQITVTADREGAEGRVVSASADVTGGEGQTRCEWTDSDGGQQTGPRYRRAFDSPGTKTLTVRVFDEGQHAATPKVETARVRVYARLKGSITGPSRAERGPPVQLSSDIRGGKTPLSYEWKNERGQVFTTKGMKLGTTKGDERRVTLTVRDQLNPPQELHLSKVVEILDPELAITRLTVSPPNIQPGKSATVTAHFRANDLSEEDAVTVSSRLWMESAPGTGRGYDNNSTRKLAQGRVHRHSATLPTRKDAEEGAIRITARVTAKGKTAEKTTTARIKKIISVEEATMGQMAGTYNVSDPERSLSQYRCHAYLYKSGKGKAKELLDGKLGKPNHPKAVDANGYHEVNWSYKNNVFIFDWTAGGKYSGNGYFKGTVKGNTDNFTLSGHWAGGRAGRNHFRRVK